MTDKQIRNAIKGYLVAGSGADVRVVNRWKQAINVHDWLASLASLTNNAIINGWYITRVAKRNDFKQTQRWEKQWEYELWYFRSYRGGNEDDNSEFDVNAILDAVEAQFENAPTLGFLASINGMAVDKHSELQVRSIDTIDDKVHVARCVLTVYLTKQPTA